ncbi:hypothetical protein ACWEPC_09860 [Nonomuraea sp. NPDC004297]
MRSDSGGFVADMLSVRGCAAQVHRPALIITTHHDRSVPFAPAEPLAAVAMPNDKMVISRADSHMIWYGSDYPRTPPDALLPHHGLPAMHVQVPLCRALRR